MPIYEYECSACKHRFERSQRFSDAPLTECPECGGPVRRVLHPAGIVFKGSGWYATDSRKPAPSESSSAAKADGAADKGETKSEAKSESSPETKKSEPKTETASGAKSASTASSGSAKKD